MDYKTSTISVLLLVCLSAIAFASNENNEKAAVDNSKSHNLIVGERRYGDRVLFHNEIHVHRKLLRTVHYDIKYPSHYSNARIHYIEVRDQKTDNTGGYPAIHSGGINKNHVTIRLTSQRNHGLHYNVTIIGR